MPLNSVITVLYNKVSENAAKDELDVLCQVNAVSSALEQLGYIVNKRPFPGNTAEMLEELKRTKPLLIFNLVEAVSGNGKLSYLAPSMLEALNIKYTGCSAEAIFLTTNKLVTKRLLRSYGIPTPQWISLYDNNSFAHNIRYIIKPIYEDGSVCLHQDSIVTIKSINEAKELLKSMSEKNGKEFFAEEYIEGREINIPMLGYYGKPEVLPPSEIKFIGYKEKHIEEILDYRSKWDENSFEYKNTVPSFNFDCKDNDLLKSLRDISIECWWKFSLKGYARIDFRVDGEGNPWVLEINANPCITPEESGFIRSAALYGLDYTQVVKRIISEL